MTQTEFPQFPFGAVYFRKSNPPKTDWEKDYQTASEDGMTAFRHWFLWSAIETAPGVFDWADYDAQLDLGAKYGIQAIIAEMSSTMTPEWALRHYDHARMETVDGTKVHADMHISCAVSGFQGCLDHDDYREAVEQFIRQLVLRYKDHPGLGGYDVWNECGLPARVCYCPATAQKFRQWLKEKYGDLRTLAEVWHRYSYADWDHIMPPRTPGPYPHYTDWLQFRIDNVYQQMQWRVDLIRSLDPDHLITAHGIAMSLRRMASHANDDWRAAGKVDAYGYTWGSCRHGDEPWKQFHAVDLVRASSRGKPFWHAESYGGPLWMAPNVIGKPRNEGRIASPEDIRYWHFVSFMAGAAGAMYLRWRPLLDGPLFGAFGPYGMDGSRTDRSQMSSTVANWVKAPAQQPLWQSRPVKGSVGIVYVPETQLFTYAQQQSADYFSQSLEGAYQGFFDANIQADWVHVDHIEEYDLLYLPYPVALNQRTAENLKAWVKAGGTLVAEGCPGYWDGNAHVGPLQPNLGLDELFGVTEDYVEFTPDLLDDLELTVHGTPVRGGLFLQAYQPTTARAVGWYADGQIAACDNHYGQGRTRVIGTMCGAGYWRHTGQRSPAFFREILDFAKKTQHITCSDRRIKARLHHGQGGTYVWVANPARQPVPVRLELSAAWGPFTDSRILWGTGIDSVHVAERTIELTVPARDVAVMKLEFSEVGTVQ